MAGLKVSNAQTRRTMVCGRDASDSCRSTGQDVKTSAIGTRFSVSRCLQCSETGVSEGDATKGPFSRCHGATSAEYSYSRADRRIRPPYPPAQFSRTGKRRTQPWGIWSGDPHRHFDGHPTDLVGPAITAPGPHHRAQYGPDGMIGGDGQPPAGRERAPPAAAARETCPQAQLQDVLSTEPIRMQKQHINATTLAL